MANKSGAVLVRVFTIKTFAFALIAVATTTAAFGLQGRLETGTDRGAVIVKIAIPEFQPAAADAKTTALTAIFNRVLWDDLDFSGGVSIVGRSFYPVGRFRRP